MQLPATPRPSGPGIDSNDPKTWGDPKTWPSRLTCLAVPHTRGQYRGDGWLVVAASDPGAYVRRFSCGVETNGGKSAPTWKPWGNIPADGSRPAFLQPNWPASFAMWPLTYCLFVEYAAPDTPWSLGGLDLSPNYRT